MGELLTPTHLMVVLIVALILFGGKKIPELGKGLGEGIKGFREGLRGITDPLPPQPTQQQTASAQPPASPTQAEQK